MEESVQRPGPTSPDPASAAASAFGDAFRAAMARGPNPFREMQLRRRRERRRLKAKLGKQEFTRRDRRGEFATVGLSPVLLAPDKLDQSA